LPEQINGAQSVFITKSSLFGERNGIILEEEALEEIGRIEGEWRRKLRLSGRQELYFSATSYGAPVPVCPNIADTRYLYTRSAIFFTGIANDSEFASYMSDKYSVEGSIKFADHCNFTKSDIDKINSWAKKHPGSAIYTTEKDSKRLIGNAYLSKDVLQRLFYIPIETNIIPQSRKTSFFNQILPIL
jgi:hypothetical protein